jgi:asparagine synthase (glutamine-hydrolysing)
MCGIAGVVWKQGPDAALVPAMTRRLAHRGPDDEQLWQDERVALGFRRLSIVDPAHGRQPVLDEDGAVIAVCNGEIYNHRAHRIVLRCAGHRFRSDGDAEVIPHLYEAQGEDFVRQLHGKFALALYDRRRRRLVLARDGLGVKPLYYLDTPAGFWFASEMKSLLLAPDFQPVVDRQALDWLLTFKHIPGDTTLLDGIRLLPPGHRIVVDVARHAARVEPFYRIPDEPIRSGPDEAAEGVRRRLDEAVRRRLMSDVPLGVALSGGLDSSAVTASVARQTDRPPRTFSVFVGDRVNELPFARLVADRYHTEHHEIVVEPEAFDQVIPRILWHIEEPLSVSEVPTWYLGQAVARHVKVLLCGEGADELFGGYARFQPLNLASWLPRATLSWGYVRGINGLTAGERRRLYAPAQQPFRGPDGNPWLDAALAGARGDRLNRLLRYELTQQLRSQTLRLDKLTMAHGVEARCPFLDTDLVGYVANLPGDLKVRGRQEKLLLKAAMADRLPEAVLRRRKLGLSNPVRALFRGPFRDVCRQAFHDHRDLLDDYFAQPALEGLFGQVGHRSGRLRLPEQQLFHVYLFLRWHQVFVDGQVPEPEPPDRPELLAAATPAPPLPIGAGP